MDTEMARSQMQSHATITASKNPFEKLDSMDFLFWSLVLRDVVEYVKMTNYILGVSVQVLSKSR